MDGAENEQTESRSCGAAAPDAPLSFGMSPNAPQAKGNGDSTIKLSRRRMFESKDVISRKQCLYILGKRASLHLDLNERPKNGNIVFKQAKVPTPYPSPQRDHQSPASFSSRDSHSNTSISKIAQGVYELSADMMTHIIEPQRSPMSQISYIRSKADRVLGQLSAWADMYSEEHKAALDPKDHGQTRDTSERDAASTAPRMHLCGTAGRPNNPRPEDGRAQ